MNALSNLTWLPVLIFLAEACVVTVSTVRIISLARGRKILASLLGTFEVTIWLFAIGQVMQNLNDWSCFVAFAAGFTVGNFFGVLLEGKLALGTLVVRVITHKNGAEIVDRLKAAAYGVTSIDAQGATGAVRVILTVIPRKELGKVVGILKTCDPKVFYSIDELQSAAAGIFPMARHTTRKLLPSFFWVPRGAANVVTG